MFSSLSAKSSLIWLALLLLSALSVPLTAAAQSSGATIRLEPSSIQLGAVGHGSKQVVDFAIVNQTKGSIQISQLKPTCGCMKLLPHDIRTPLGPAEKRTFQFELSLGRGWGSFDKKIEVKLAGQGSQYLPVLATFHPGFRTSDLEFVVATAADVVIPEASDTVSIISIAGTAAPSITDLKSSDPRILVKLAKATKDQAVIEISAADYPAGRITGSIEGKCNGLPFIIPVRGRAFQQVIHDPQSWNLHQIKKAGFSEKTLQLKRADGKPLKVLSASVELSRQVAGLDLSVSPQVMADGSVQIRAYIADPFPVKSGGLYGKVTVMLDVADEKMLVIDIMGVVRVTGGKK
ncbi:MAG: DUF1573 domain-containing protein [Planctomycetota bacterium]